MCRKFSDFTEAEWRQLFNKMNEDDPEGFVPLSDTEYWEEQKANFLEM